MQLSIPYLRDQKIEVSFLDENLLGILEPNAIPSAGEKESLEEATANLAAFLKGANTVLVIINDATRPTPTSAMLSVLLPQFEMAGITDEQITILVATGAHRGVKEEELEQLLGVYTQRLKSRLVSHDAKDDETLVSVGKTRNGTPILLNRLLFSCDHIVVTGSVEPHYFAGFTGGRKAFLPGIAGFSTIEANHKLAIRDEAHSLALEGNPVHEDMMDALRHIKAPIFSLMTILDKDQKVVAATSGNIVQSFLEAVAIARSVFCVPVKEQADVVLSVAKFPMDINLYQSQKAIDNGALAVKDGGTLILVASCREGIGDETFAKLLASCSTPDEALTKIETTYKLGYHKAAKMASVSKRITVQAFTELPDELVTSLFLVPTHNLQQTMDEALQNARDRGVTNPTVLVLPDGCVTVPSVG